MKAMCTRYTLTTPLEELLAAVNDFFDKAIAAGASLEHEPRYHVPPTSNAPIVRLENGVPVLDALRWGLIPRWAIDKWKASTFNARSEEAAEKPAFRSSLAGRRCLVPADGWIEFRDEGKLKIPQFFQRPDKGLFFFAGLWDFAPRYVEGPVESFTIMTTEPSAWAAKFHDRMPCIVEGEAARRWLDERTSTRDALALLAPYPGALTVRDLDRAINRSSAPNDPGLLRPLDRPGPLFGF